MDLIGIKHYLRARKCVPLRDLAVHFRVAAETVRPLLETWMRKGKILKHTGRPTSCRGCCQCDPATIEVYAWQD